MLNIDPSTCKVGFVGVGRMGANMARRLKDCGYTISAVLDTNATVASELAKELGATATDTLCDVTRLSDVIFTVVTDDAAMRSIYTGSGDSLLKGLQGAQGKLFINCATISPAVHLEVTKAIEAAGASVLEAPMASSIPQARDGKLYMMCAGKEDVFKAALPLLEKMTVKLIYTGAAGSAANIKALVNMVMNINTAGLAEGLGLAEALGLDLTMVRDVFSQTGAASRVLQTDGEDMQLRGHEPYFSAAHAAKDSRIALSLAQEHRLALPLAEATLGQYNKMVEHGLGDLDKSGISELTFPSRQK